MARTKSLTARMGAVHTKRLGALSVFSDAALDLDEAAGEYRDIADEAYETAAFHTQVATDAVINARQAADHAAAIRTLIHPAKENA